MQLTRSGYYEWLNHKGDLHSRKVKGWAMSGRMTADLVVEALKMALKTAPFAKGILFHSDRDVQYASYAFKAVLAENGMYKV